MRILSKRTLREFWQIHGDCKNQLLSWYRTVKLSKYGSSEEVLREFSNCRAIGKNRYVFKIKGNKYRLIVKMNFDLSTVWIRFIGTHSEYDNIDALKV